MKKSIPAANPDAYVESFDGWQRATVEALRAAVTLNAGLGNPQLAAKGA